MEIWICENMREEIYCKLDGGHFCVLTKTLPHEFDRGGGISHIGVSVVGQRCKYHPLLSFGE